MSRRHSWLAQIVLVAGAAVASAMAAERPLQKSDIPAAVLASVAATYPSAEPTAFAQETEDGELVYEVQLTLEGRRVELTLLPNGKLVVEQCSVSLEEAPDAVRKGWEGSKFAQWKVVRIEQIVEARAPQDSTYELLVQRGDARHELVFSQAGRLQSHEGESECEEGDGHEGEDADDD